MLIDLPDTVLLSAPRSVSITGCVFPFRVDEPEPWLCAFPGYPECWLPIFSDLDKLREGMAQLGAEPNQYTVKKIDDGREFLLSVQAGGVRVALDPRPDPVQGTTRWTEIVAEGAAC